MSLDTRHFFFFFPIFFISLAPWLIQYISCNMHVLFVVDFLCVPIPAKFFKGIFFSPPVSVSVRFCTFLCFSVRFCQLLPGFACFCLFLSIYIRLFLFMSVFVCFCKFLSFLSISFRLWIFLVLVILSAHNKRLSVSHTHDFFYGCM